MSKMKNNNHKKVRIISKYGDCGYGIGETVDICSASHVRKIQAYLDQTSHRTKAVCSACKSEVMLVPYNHPKPHTSVEVTCSC